MGREKGNEQNVVGREGEASERLCRTRRQDVEASPVGRLVVHHFISNTLNPVAYRGFKRLKFFLPRNNNPFTAGQF